MRFRLQFSLPATSPSSPVFKLNDCEISEAERGHKMLNLSDKEALSITSTGEVIYSSESAEWEDIDNVYESALEKVETYVDINPKETSISIIIEGELPVRQYLEHEEEIEEFADEYFGSDHRYFELRDGAIKLSFGKPQSKIAA